MMMSSEINIYTLNRIRQLTCCHQVPKDFPVKTLSSKFPHEEAYAQTLCPCKASKSARINLRLRSVTQSLHSGSRHAGCVWSALYYDSFVFRTTTSSSLLR